MKKTISILGLIALLSVGCTKRPASYREPVYVSSTTYETVSCKELELEFPKQKPNFNYSCTELKDFQLFILPTEYEKLSCKQLHEQFIKVKRKYDSDLRLESDSIPMIIALPVLLVTTGGLPLLDHIKLDSNSSSYLDPKKISENIAPKEAYETLKEVATKKNCSFVKDIPDIKEKN